MCFDGIYKYGRSRLYGRQPSSYDIDLKNLIEINGVYIEVYNEQRYYTLFELYAWRFRRLNNMIVVYTY